MGTRSGYLTRRPSFVWLVVLTAWIGVAEATAQVETTPEQQALRTSISERYEVVRLSQGVGLVPKAAGSDVRLIELTDGTVAVNGVLVSGQELRELVGEDAGLIVQLTYLDADARLALFDIDRPAEAAEPAANAPPPRPAEVSETPRPRRRTDRRGGIVRLLGSVTVDADELVDGDIVVIAGSLRVDGAVDGDIVVVGGSADFGPAASAEGDVTVVGGALRRDPTARIRGQIHDIGLGLLSFEDIGVPHFRVRPVVPFFRLGNVMATVLRLVFLGMLASVVLFVARGPVERVARRSALEPLKAGIVGLLAQLLLFPLLVIAILVLAVSIIGIPLLLLVPFALVAALLVMVAGFTGVAQAVGQWTSSRFGKDPHHLYVAVWIGVALILAPALLGKLVDVGGFFRIFGVALALTGFLVEYAAWTTGIGAAVLNRFGPAPLPQRGTGPAMPPQGPPAPPGPDAASAELPPPALEEPPPPPRTSED